MSDGLEAPGAYPPARLKAAFRAVRRAAAVDTGAIEQLYPVERGFTFTIALEGALWESVLNKKQEDVRSLIQAQLDAYELLVDLATGAMPVSEASIRRLHEQVCAAQLTHRVVTAVGPQDQELMKGAYKTHPNNVLTADGTRFSYCPPRHGRTGDEAPR
jgi:hypothetical protein